MAKVDLYTEVQSTCNKTILKTIPHYIIPGLNLRTEEVESDEDDERIFSYPYNCELPLPFLPPSPASNQILVTRERLRHLEFSDKKVFTVSNRDAEFLKVVASDPDKEFDGMYNWYYTGGCMDILNVNGNMCLATTHGEKNDCLRYIGVRQHKTCHLYTVTEDFNLENIMELESKFPFTGIDINPYCIGRYCTINTKRFIQEWDVPKGVSRFSWRSPLKYGNLPDKWCSVAYGCGSDIIMMADRAYVHLLDLREQEPVQTTYVQKSDHLEICEDISLMFQSSIKDFAWYICTNHHILLFDIRKNIVPMQQWTHLMRSPPLYGHSVPTQMQQEEVICIAGQHSGEIVSLINSWNGHIPYSEVMPLSLPNLHDSLLSAHHSGQWLDPAVQQRVKLSLMGLVWLPSEPSQLRLLSQTSAGDVFNHILSRKDVENKSISNTLKPEHLKCLAEWEKELLKKRSSIVRCTTRKSMVQLFRSMKNSKRKLSEKKRRKRSEQNNLMMSKERMLSYVDFLAPRILEAWDIENEPEWNRNITDHEPSPEPNDKVQTWLNTVNSEYS
ncbi:hypothetical protein C0J52_21971 [Blattella germanica]|nr:hypothetical protein C0J52_21971 [Blattella germanica]